MRFSKDGLSKLLLLSFFIMPFTELRFGVVGVGEVLLIICFILLLLLDKGKVLKGPIFFPVSFWSLFILFLFIGFSYNFFILNHVSGTIEQAAFDLLAYFFVLILCVITSNSRNLGKEGAFVFFFRLYFLWSVVFSLLFVLSFFYDSFFGLTLRTYLGFTPLVNNVHQTAMLFCVLPFIGMYFLAHQKATYTRIWLFFSIFSFILMAIESTATKAIMALVVGGFIFTLSFVLFKSKNRKFSERNIIFILVFFIISVVVLYVNDFLLYKLLNFFAEEDSSQARENIYTYGLFHATNSLFFGYGPGPHIFYSGSYWDTHMTFLTILLQSGLFGLILFCVFLFRVIKMIYWSPTLLASFSAIMVYALGGDILRRLPIWIVIIAIITLSGFYNEEKRPSLYVD